MLLKRNHSIPKLIMVVIFFLLAACTLKQESNPPIANIIPKIDTIHDDIRIDNYFWMQDKSDPTVIEYLEAENKYTEEMLKHTENLQEELYEELVSRIKETDLTLPDKIDEYYYYTRTEEGKQYPLYCRMKGSLDASEEVLVDPNNLAIGYQYFKVGDFRVTANHQLVAFTVDTTGSNFKKVYIKNFTTGELLDSKILNSFQIRWANDNKTLFYTTLDSTGRPHKLYRHTLGTDPKDDELIYHEKDKAFYLFITKTRSKKYLILSSSDDVTSEVRYLDADNPAGDFKIIHPRQPKMSYIVGHHDNTFYIRTNDNAPNFKVMKVAVQNPSKKYWKEVIPHKDSVKIEGLDVFKNHLFTIEREKGIANLKIVNLTTNEVHYVEFPEPDYRFWIKNDWYGMTSYDTNILRIEYQSLVTPTSIFDYHMNTKNRELKKQQEVLGGYNPLDYQSERIFAEAEDGTMIPISLLYKKGMVKDGNNPLLLYGYGYNGESMDPWFESDLLSLLDRGIIYAVAHVRGGGEMGGYWYEQGKLLKKRNTFTDFISCAEYLMTEKYTTSDKLIIKGESGGGLLVGAVVNMRPDLCKAVIANVPWVDILNTFLYTSDPIDYEELGNPYHKEYYNYIKSYSPYDNVKAMDYPNMLITSNLGDAAVMYWEPAKWTAKLRALKTDDNLLLLKMNMAGGHGGPSGRYDRLKDMAFEYAYILDLLEIKQ